MSSLIAICNNKVCGKRCRAGCIQFGEAEYCFGCKFTVCWLVGDFIEITIIYCKKGG